MGEAVGHDTEGNGDLIEVSDEEFMEWIGLNPDLASEWLAMALDLVADKLGRSQEARLARVIATRAWELHMLILGHEELDVRNADSGDE